MMVSPGTARSLDKVIQCGRIQQLKYILNDNDNEYLLRNNSGTNPLLSALQIEDERKRKIMFNFILSKGASINCTDPKTGRDVFAWACFLGRAEQIKRMIDIVPCDVILLKHDQKGLIPLHHACRSGNPFAVYHVVREMKKYSLSVDIEIKENGMTPFLEAKRLGYELIANILQTEGSACPTQFDKKTFRTKTRWSEIGREERDSQDMQKLLSEVRLTGSIRPHTSFQARRTLSTQQRKPEIPQATRPVFPSEGMRPNTAPGIRQTSDGHRSGNAHSEMYADMQLVDLKDVIDGKAELSDFTKDKGIADDDAELQSNPDIGVPSKSHRRSMVWSKLNSLMSLSDEAHVLSSDSFVSSVSQISSDSETHKGHQDKPGADHGAMLITNFMTTLSQQMSTSFRQNAVPKVVPRPKTPPQAPKKKKPSTLAFIMQTMKNGPQRRSAMSRRGSVSGRALRGSSTASTQQNIAEMRRRNKGTVFFSQAQAAARVTSSRTQGRTVNYLPTIKA